MSQESCCIKPYPWNCSRCRQRSVQPVAIDYLTNVEHEGLQYEVSVHQMPAARCTACGEMVLDDEANVRISDTFRRQLGLLMPAQILQNRQRLGLTQNQLADSLGVAAPALAHWETGAQIQPRSVDRLLRLYFSYEQVRTALADEAQLASLMVSN